MLTVGQCLLKPVGMVYIDVLNRHSNGAALLGNYWRGIETPRHHVPLNPASLTGLRAVTGFSSITSFHFKYLTLTTWKVTE